MGENKGRTKFSQGQQPWGSASARIPLHIWKEKLLLTYHCSCLQLLLSFALSLSFHAGFVFLFLSANRAINSSFPDLGHHSLNRGTCFMQSQYFPSQLSGNQFPEPQLPNSLWSKNWFAWDHRETSNPGRKEAVLHHLPFPRTLHPLYRNNASLDLSKLHYPRV